MLAAVSAHSAGMSENVFIKKRQKERRKQSFLTVKLILRLVVASVLMWLGFLYFVGDTSDGQCVGGGCEAEYSLATYALAGLIMLVAVIALGALVGSLIGYLRRSRSTGNFSSFVDQHKSDD